MKRVVNLFGAIGTESERSVRELIAALVERLRSAPAEHALFGAHPDEKSYEQGMHDLGRAFLDRGWHDSPVAEVLEGLKSELLRAQPLAPTVVADTVKWVRTHESDDAEAVLDCLRASPPRGFVVHRVLSRAGSQKLVFRASIANASRDVVLKKLSGSDPGQVAAIFERELQASPLRNRHPNIIETFSEQNAAGETFIVEELLTTVLNDETESGGVERAGQLLFDLSSALEFLHGRNLVHGDIKPDNIGLENKRFILLDFGICRPPDKFVGGTGSLRTQAPELLQDQPNSKASDIWALGATVLNYLGLGFPFLDKGEVPPKDEDARARFREDVIARLSAAEERVSDKLTQVPDPALRDLLRRMLLLDPGARPSAGAILAEMRLKMPQIVGGRNPESNLPPLEPVKHTALLLANFPPPETVAYLPDARRQELLVAVKSLLNQAPAEMQDHLTALVRRLGQA